MAEAEAKPSRCSALSWPAPRRATVMGVMGLPRAFQGAQVLHPQVVVGGRQTITVCRFLPGGGEGEAPAQGLPQFPGVVRPVDGGGGGLEGGQVPVLAAEGQRVHHPGGGQQAHRPRAKASAEAMAQGVGSSSTRSAPPARARAERVHLSAMAQSPRWTQWPLMTHTAAPSGPRTSLVRARWKACPRWNGLYSATMPAAAIAVPPNRKRKKILLSDKMRVVLFGKKGIK